MDDPRVQILDRIQRLTQKDDAKSTGATQDLKREYNRIVDKVYHDSPAEFWDIIEVFPPEIWIRIIQESLPEQDYPSALLLLITVSAKWQQAILSTPILWAHIQICGLDEDLLATIDTFTHLSRHVDLTVTLYVPYYIESEMVDSILASLHSRLHRLVIVGEESLMGDPYKFTHYFDPQISAETRELLRSSQDIDSQQFNALTPMRTSVTLDMILISPRLKSIRDWRVGYDRDPTGRPFRYLEAFKWQNSEDAFEWFLFHSPYFSNIGIIESGIHDKRSLHRCPALPNLTRLCLTKEHVILPMAFLSMIGPQLLELELKTLHSQYSDVLGILINATKLVKLSLTLCLEKPGYEPSRPTQAAKRRIATLRDILLRFDYNSSAYATSEWRTQVQVLTDFRILYPDVEYAFFFFSLDPVEKDVVPPFLEYLSSLRNLKQLRVYLTNELQVYHPQTISFPALEVLLVSTPYLLAYLDAPQLLSLLTLWYERWDELHLVDYPSVRTLTTATSMSEQSELVISGDDLPSLNALTLNGRGLLSLRVHSFQLLAELTIVCHQHSHPATSLCFSILFYPEELPSLRNIKFLERAPEWDVLLTMLERRNLLARTDISRIRRLTLPHVPYRLYAPLAALLRGMYTVRPPNEELCFTKLIEPFFDEELPGCHSCIRDMRGKCNEVTRKNGYGTRLDVLRASAFLLASDTVPVHPEPEIQGWISRRQKEIRRLESSPSSSGDWWRQDACSKRARIRPLEITEHDFFEAGKEDSLVSEGGIIHGVK